MVAFSSGANFRGGYRTTWRTKRFKAKIDAAILEAMHHVEEQAWQFWLAEWAKTGEHPDARGDERNKGYARVKILTGKRVRLIVGSTSQHTRFEEVGTPHRAAHSVLRKTLDVTAPKLSPALRRALKNQLSQ